MDEQQFRRLRAALKEKDEHVKDCVSPQDTAELIKLLKKRPGAAHGLLHDSSVDGGISDEESAIGAILEDALKDIDGWEG